MGMLLKRHKGVEPKQEPVKADKPVEKATPKKKK